MSENEKAILKSYEAFNNRDINGFLGVYADDLTISYHQEEQLREKITLENGIME